MTSSVFYRAPDLLMAASATGCWITDTEGKRYLDGSGGAIVNGVGHGRAEVIEAIHRQLSLLDYHNAHLFRSPVVEEYAAEVAARAPMDDARIFPVSGGSEATETAIKLALAYHQARGEGGRDVIIARRSSYHGNSLGALDVSHRHALRAPYESWLGRTVHLPPVNEFRCPNPDHPTACGRWHARQFEQRLVEIGPDRVAAFIGEAIGGATLGAAVPPDDYWPAVAEVCSRHGVLLIVDEVMTGFGRTGSWFASQHWNLRPDIVTAGKGAASGYWPLGLCVASGEVYATVGDTFRHGFTFSHHPGGAAAGLAVLGILTRESLLDRVTPLGARLVAGLASLGMAADIRGRGLMVGVELTAEPETRRPYPRHLRIAERVTAEARSRGLLVYPVTGCADGIDGDGLMFGPPFVITEDEIDLAVGILGETLTHVLGAVGSGTR